MKRHLKVLLVLLTFVTGCRSYRIPQAGTNHPAHPEAAVSSGIEQTEKLEVDESSLPEAPEAMKKQEMKDMQ